MLFVLTHVKNKNHATHIYFTKRLFFFTVKIVFRDLKKNILLEIIIFCFYIVLICRYQK
jgi:hypothetical protein